MHRIFTVILILFFIGCSDASSPELDNFIVGKVSFDLGFSFRPKHTGIIYDSANNKPLIYFANVVSKKMIKAFDENGKFRWSVPLDSVCKPQTPIADLCFKNRDTIILLIDFHNELIVLDRKGRVTRRIQLNASPYNDGYLYRFFDRCLLDSSRDRYTLFLGLEKEDSIGSNVTGSMMDRINKYYINTWKSSQVGKISSVFSDSLVYAKGCNVYKRISPHDSTRYFVEGSKFLLVDDKLIFFSHFADSVYIYSKDFVFEKAIPIASKHTSLGFTPLDIDVSNSSILAQDRMNQRGQSKGLIAALYYDPYRSQWHIVAFSEIPVGFYKENGYRPWVLMIYDNGFNKLNEFEFLNNNYHPFLIPAESGLLIQKVQKHESNALGKAEFSIFDFTE